LCVVCLLEEDREWLDEFRSTMEGRFAGDGERDGILEDRQASACSCGESADLDIKWESCRQHRGERFGMPLEGGGAHL
jgi:hypothetical protein